jgi:hypothetical protein
MTFAGRHSGRRFGHDRSMVALAFGLSAAIYVVIGKIALPPVGLGAAIAALLLLVGLWHVAPRARRVPHGARLTSRSRDPGGPRQREPPFRVR